MRSAATLFVALLHFAWAVLCIGTCTYLVFWQGHSSWWFVLAIMLASGASS